MKRTSEAVPRVTTSSRPCRHDREALDVGVVSPRGWACRSRRRARPPVEVVPAATSLGRSWSRSMLCVEFGAERMCLAEHAGKPQHPVASGGRRPTWSTSRPSSGRHGIGRRHLQPLATIAPLLSSTDGLSPVPPMSIARVNGAPARWPGPPLVQASSVSISMPSSAVSSGVSRRLSVSSANCTGEAPAA